jgi:hypothetical protein
MRFQALQCLAAGVGLSLLFTASCGSGQTPASKIAKSAAQSSRWITHKDSHHYSVESPPGWAASPNKQKGWVQLTGTQGEGVLIWPVFIPGAVDTRFAPLIHLRLAAASPYNAQWQSPQMVTPNALCARGASGDKIATSVFTWVSSPKGLAGFFYVVTAREPDYRQRQNDFARILQSFHIIGAETPGAAAAPAAGPGGLQYVRFSDPKEGAFTIDVPAGWKTEGGLFRFHAIDPRAAVESVSPDGQMRIRCGDATIPPFVDPIMGMAEGSVYAPYGYRMQVQRFTPAAIFCRDYALSRMAQVCPDIEVTEVKDRPDLIPQVTATAPDLGRAARLSVGQARFRCGRQAQSPVGFCEAVTASPAGVTFTWHVAGIEVYQAPPEKASTAESIMRYVAGSRRYNQEWQTMQLQLTAAASRAVSGNANDMANMIARSQKARDAIDDEIARRRSNATLGTVDLADPETGRRMSVESGSDYYWVDPRGVIVGTNTNTVPAVDFRALLQLP